jgi:hypothetical protein
MDSHLKMFPAHFQSVYCKVLWNNYLLITRNINYELSVLCISNDVLVARVLANGRTIVRESESIWKEEIMVYLKICLELVSKILYL